MRVLIYTHPFAPSIGGVETYVMLLAQGLARFAAPPGETLDVTVATRTPAGSTEDAAFPFRVARQPGLAALLRLIREADVIHLAGPVFLPLLLSLLMRKSVVLEHHGYTASCPNGLLFHEPTQTVCPGHFLAGHYGECVRCNKFKEGWLRSVWMLVWPFPRRWLCRHVAGNAPITDHVLLRLELPRSRTIYYGIPESEVVDQSLGNHSGSGDRICFAYLGRLVSLKGLSILLEAARCLKDKGYDFQVRFIGEGPERTSLSGLAQSWGMDKCVVFTGLLTGEDFRREVEKVDVVMMPSIWEETAGLAAIEQMMRGRLVIASSIGGLGEVIGAAGLQFPPGDAAALARCMKQVIDDPAIIGRLGAAARERALVLFGQEKMVEQHILLSRRL